MKNLCKPFVLCRVIPKYRKVESVYFNPILPMFNGVLHRLKWIVRYTLGGYRKC